MTKRIILSALAAFSLFGVSAKEDTKTIRIFDEVTFYDGYLLQKFPEDCPTDDGITRFRTSLYSVPLSEDFLSQIGTDLKMHVYVKAACDNYDRIGNVNLAFVPKGATTYNPDETMRIEVGRFITPFMDKNKQPDTVPYEFNVKFLSKIFRSVSLREKYDFWLEFELFGIPYAANTQIEGCAGHNDVFIGSIDFETDAIAAPLTDEICLAPIVIKRPEYQGGNFNNYQEGATDKLGSTVKTWEFELPEDVESGRLYLITSNHGANTGGEEYNRRTHNVYFDDALGMQYTPGGKSCENFRVYNTQANGIYGAEPRPSMDWTSWNNWCPGDVIPTRILDIFSPLAAGKHALKIRVLSAKFADKQGDIPVSAFFIGNKKPEKDTDFYEDTETFNIYNEVVFYDGYQLKNFPEECPTDDGILRHRTSLYSMPLTDDLLDRLGKKLVMHVNIKASCDNYDRIGNVNLAFVPKGASSYEPENVERIEIARFITPFMNKNIEPDVVPYDFEISNVGDILRDSRLRAEKDIWLEFELFGIPYAANTQVSGCAGRQDVFFGSIDFETSMDKPGATDNNVVVPIVIKRPEYQGGNLNNYNATDEAGTTKRTWNFNVPEDMEDARLVIITSNHGANAGGEEYNRRWHYVYYDGELEMTYKPGRNSCEPYRQYNTQGNGIYGRKPMNEDEWQEFSNWCPGDKIDTRMLLLENVKAGEHSVSISVPDAVFADGQGDIPVSIYFQGSREGKISDFVEMRPYQPLGSWYLDGDRCLVRSEEPIRAISLYTTEGQLLHSSNWINAVSTKGCAKGIYVLTVEYDNGAYESFKLIL